MNKDRLQERFNDWCDALGRLREILSVPEDHIGRVDAIIQRFEFTYEMAWKSMKAALEVEGHVTPSPKLTFTKAYALGWLVDDTPWINMIYDRNKTSHMYDEAQAVDIVQRVPEYLNIMLQAYEHIRKQTDLGK
jgi:nucleotidyltransferase substrate binding protein (TIGR01987 family)